MIEVNCRQRVGLWKVFTDFDMNEKLRSLRYFYQNTNILEIDEYEWNTDEYGPLPLEEQLINAKQMRKIGNRK